MYYKCYEGTKSEQKRAIISEWYKIVQNYQYIYCHNHNTNQNEKTMRVKSI